MADNDSTKKPRSHLVKARHVQHDFFIADVFECAIKDDMASMEHPVFALKAGDTKDRLYSHNGVSISVRATSIGLPTIFDKDVWIYCISKLVAAMNNGEPTSRKIQFTAYDYLVSTNRDTGGVNYKRLRDSLERLNGTTITTDIETAGKRQASCFGLIDSWNIIEQDNKTERMIAIEVNLPDWLYNSVLAMEVLTISPDYFRIRKPLDRRIYEIARKHCGNQTFWVISLELLLKKSGSTTTLREFRKAIKSLADSGELPDYRVTFDVKTDQLTIYRKGETGRLAEIGRRFGSVSMTFNYDLKKKKTQGDVCR